MRLGLFLAIFSFTLIAPMVVPDVAVAQISLAEYAGCSGPDCSACNLVNLANGLIGWLIGFLFIIFAVILAYAGFGLVTSGGNHHELDEAKNRFVNALIGLLIVLSAWLIVDTIMRGLVGREGSEGQIPNGQVTGWLYWSTVECYDQPDPQGREFTPETFEPNEAIPGSEDTTIIPATISGPAGMPVPNPTTGSNCSFNESSLVSIPGQGNHRATAYVAARFGVMRNSLSSLRVTSSYRSDARQTELWDECPRCQTQGTVARPCSRGGNGSRHSSGVALDLTSSGGRAGRCDIVRVCRAAGASFIMMYSGSGHVHCDWGGRRGEVNVSC
jgi:hypothetical protein